MMRFNELMRRVGDRGVELQELRAGPDPEILRVCEDSRKVQPGDLFVARSGSKTTGAKFVSDALAKGAVAMVIEPSPGIAIPGPQANVAFAQVNNANLACALLAHEIAGNPTADMTMIGITGTKGKTTVAYLLRSVLKAAGKKVGMIGTVEIDDGQTLTPADLTTPGSVDLVALFSRMRANAVTHCIMEVSSHALHQHRVAGIDFALAIFTNLTGDHLDYHKTMENYAAAKALLFEALPKSGTAVVNADDKWAQRILLGCNAHTVRYSLKPRLAPALGPGNPPNGAATWTADIHEMTASRMNISVHGPGIGRDPSVMAETPLVGRHNAYNILAVIAAADALHLEIPHALATLLHDKGAPGRLQPVAPAAMGRDQMPFQVFVDFAHTHDALENVLSAVRATMRPRQTCSDDQSRDRQGATNSQATTGESDCRDDPRRDRKGAFGVAGDATLPNGHVSDDHPHSPRLICVFGCGGDRDRTKRPKMGAVAQNLADRVFVTSDNPRTEQPGAIIEEICTGFSPDWRESGKITVKVDRRAAIRMAIGEARAGDVVVIAGKGHENYQIVGTTKHHFDDVEEAQAALQEILNHDDTTARRKNG